MTASKALAILSDALKGHWPNPMSDLDVAIKLSMEALKRHREQTKNLRSGHPFLLPGETEE